MPNVIPFRCRKMFTKSERHMLIVATQAWSDCVRQQSISFGFSDEGEEYAVVVDDFDNVKAHIGFTKCHRPFVDSVWYGFHEAKTIDELVVNTMPDHVKPVYYAMIQEKQA